MKCRKLKYKKSKVKNIQNSQNYPGLLTNAHSLLILNEKIHIAP